MKKSFMFLLLYLLLFTACSSTETVVEPTIAEATAVSPTASLAPTQAANADTATPVYQPLPDEECSALRDTVASVLDTQAELQEAAFNDYVQGQMGRGCEITVTGTGETFGHFLDVAALLQTALTEAGWTPDMAYLADGPTGTAMGFRKGDQLALFNVDWQPSADANCPADEPISACDLTPAQQLFTITLNLAEAVSN